MKEEQDYHEEDYHEEQREEAEEEEEKHEEDQDNGQKTLNDLFLIFLLYEHG